MLARLSQVIGMPVADGISLNRYFSYRDVNILTLMQMSPSTI